ncbi:fatty acid hydroperoxide lyase, chloroplastic [Andrographis paniculata]|uniref:fatty acid hydroperoxide lyase, chloroplastic n=1 Tax=Andrographis paniculata TaxID=175694 RepID=UPI0021E74EF8|nr:fatty acid hydroperoxide lyase, chloroplastic [Andrographis paniculata]
MNGGAMASWKIMASPSVAPLSPSPTPQRMSIPGSYGFPVIGPLVDRLNYFWFQGPSDFFKNRIDKYKSTVFRTNVPPAFPFFLGVNPNVVAVLDVKSFAHLFDLDLVEKNVLVGDFKPSLSFTGGMEVCAYLDTADPKHSQLKEFAIDTLRRSAATWTPEILSSLTTLFDEVDAQLSGGGGSVITLLLLVQQFLFTYLSRVLLGADPAAVPEMKKSGHIMVDRWLALQLAPTIPILALQPLVEIFLHSFPYPFFLVQSDYNKLASFIKSQAKEALHHAQTSYNLTESEAINNLLFMFGFNAFGGFTLFLPTLLTFLESQKDVHPQLRNEVRSTLKSSGSETLSYEIVREMDLINSFVYEALRLSPPVPSQFGRARKDFDLTSHDAIYAIKKGEMLCGYQPLVMQDPKIFQSPADFVYDRFSDKKGGRELLKYLYWSNGPQQAGETCPAASNKQCPGRDFVPATVAFFLAFMFQRYDDIQISSGNITALRKAK